jgi:hypothetical protein
MSHVDTSELKPIARRRPKPGDFVVYATYKGSKHLLIRKSAQVALKHAKFLQTADGVSDVECCQIKRTPLGHVVKVPVDSADLVAFLKAQEGHWGEHPKYQATDWINEVSNKETRLGYWDWVCGKLDAANADAEAEAQEKSMEEV